MLFKKDWTWCDCYLYLTQTWLAHRWRWYWLRSLVDVKENAGLVWLSMQLSLLRNMKVLWTYAGTMISLFHVLTQNESMVTQPNVWLLKALSVYLKVLCLVTLMRLKFTKENGILYDSAKAANVGGVNCFSLKWAKIAFAFMDTNSWWTSQRSWPHLLIQLKQLRTYGLGNTTLQEPTLLPLKM